MTLEHEPAAPVPGLSALPNGDFFYPTGGLTAREYAAIHLRVPSSGTPWLDEMVHRSLSPAPLPPICTQMGNALRFLVTCSAPMTPQQEECWPALRAALAAWEGYPK